MGASKGEAKPQVEIKDLDVEKVPIEEIKNKELYLIELMSKKKSITEKHVNEGIKPTSEDHMMMTRLNIEITEYMQKIFHPKKKRKKLQKKIKENYNKDQDEIYNKVNIDETTYLTQIFKIFLRKRFLHRRSMSHSSRIIFNFIHLLHYSFDCYN